MSRKKAAAQPEPRSGIKKNSEPPKILLHETIRRLREERNLSGSEVCRAGQLDPRTLTAVEKGRIKNPSIETLHAIAQGLSLSISDLFRRAECGEEKNFHVGTQKGSFALEFIHAGIKIISFTPFVHHFFCGKLLFAGKKNMPGEVLNHPYPLFVSPLMGRFEVRVEERKLTLTEGQNVFFNGRFSFSIRNLLLRDSVLLLVTAPSIVKSRSE
jgi:transcriptional regulator with XRE-family HTH domain